MEKLAVFSQRFGAKRLRKVIDENMSATKREIISRSAFKNLLNISAFAAPMELIEFISQHTNARLREFRHGKRVILFTREMVVKVLGVPAGPRPLDLLKRSDECELRDLYRNEKGRPTIAKAIHELEHCDDRDEAAVVRNFGLVAFATVLCPGTGNMTNLEYLASLMDKDSIEQYAIDEHILSEVMSEVEVLQAKIKKRSDLDVSKIQWVGQCLPLLAIIYMDFMSFPPLPPNVHRIQYATPRICFVTDEDFQLVIEVDKNKLSLSPTAFGKRPLLPLSETLYAVPVIEPPPIAPSQTAAANNSGSQDAEGNASASLNDWIDKGFQSTQDFEVPEHLQHIFNKHKELYSAEADVALMNFGVTMKGLYTRRMAALLVDVEGARRESSSFTIPCPLSFAGPSSQDTQHKEMATTPAAPHSGTDDQAKGVAPCKISQKQPVEVAELGSPSRAVPPTDVEVEDAVVGEQCLQENVEETGVFVADVAKDVTNAGVSVDGLEKFTEPAELGSPSRAVPPTDVQQTVDLGADVANEGVHAEVPEVSVKGLEKIAEPDLLGSPLRSVSPPAVDVSPRRRTVSAGYWDEPPPSMELFEPGSEDAIFFNNIPDPVMRSPVKLPKHLESPATATSEDSSGYQTPLQEDDVVPSHGHAGAIVKEAAENFVDVSSGPSTHDKKNRRKRAAKADCSPKVLKKLKRAKDVEKIYDKYIMNTRPFRPRTKDNPSKPFVQIGNFYVHYKTFVGSLKPRAWLDNQVMSLWIEKFNIENAMKAKSNRRVQKKYSFSVHLTSELIKDPAIFDANVVMAEFKNACAKYNLVKMDLIHFPILYEKHWVSCCVNILYDQFNLLDSMKSGKGRSAIGIAVNNLITNFKMIARESGCFSVDLNKFKLGGPSDYPQQTTYYDCGFYTMLYMEHFDGKSMMVFDKDYIPVYRMTLAAGFITHAMNTEDSAAVLEDECF